MKIAITDSIRYMKDYPIIMVFSILMVINIFSSTNLLLLQEFASISHNTAYVLRYFCIFLFLIYFFYRKGTQKQLIIFFAFIVLDWAIKKKANTHILFELFFVPFCLSQYVSRERLFKFLFVVSLASFIAVTVMDLIGIIHTDDYYRGEQYRYTFGFSHPNSLGFYVLYITILYSLVKDKFNVTYFCVLFILFVFNYLVPRSITSAFLLLALGVGMVWLHVFNLRSFLDRIQCKLFFILALILFTMLFFIYFVSITGIGKDFLLKMPGSIWSRFELGMVAYEKYGLSLFGSPIVAIFPDPAKNITEYFVVDCAYFYIPINYGLVIYAFFILFILIIINKAIKQRDYKYLIVLFLILVYGISETLIGMPIMMPIYAYIFCNHLSDSVTVHRNGYMQQSK